MLQPPNHPDGLLQDSLWFVSVCKRKPKSGYGPSKAVLQYQAGKNNCFCGPPGYSLANKSLDAVVVHYKGTLLTPVQYVAYQDAHAFSTKLPSPQSAAQHVLLGGATAAHIEFLQDVEIPFNSVPLVDHCSITHPSPKAFSLLTSALLSP